MSCGSSSPGFPGPRLLFEDGVPLTFPEFMESILTLRGSLGSRLVEIEAELHAVGSTA